MTDVRVPVRCLHIMAALAMRINSVARRIVWLSAQWRVSLMTIDLILKSVCGGGGGGQDFC